MIEASLGTPSPFYPLPLHSGDGAEPTASTCVVVPPWKGRRLWIQGNTGMGKTSLFREVTAAHFRSHSTAFEAYAAWGCLIVAFSARDYAGKGEDRPDPTWVIDAVKATLSETGMTFEDDNLLRRILRTGTVAVAIDGLHEAGQTNAVAAFARAFAASPMLVTSQEPGDSQFMTWRLPPDMRDFTHDLLQVYLGESAADVVMRRITASGLKDAIRSGYDVRLIIDLARRDPENSPLPSDRLGLYAAVISAGWPEAPDDVRCEQQRRTEAAAWRMVSERNPHEDKRRLKPDVDLAADLLTALADAPDREGKSVRLMRRVGGAFEFVHDQMHAYMAARWFAQAGVSITQLGKMVAGSTIWAHAIPERRTLWSFAAALLDDERLMALWAHVEDTEEWDILRRELKAEAERRGLVSGPRVATGDDHKGY